MTDQINTAQLWSLESKLYKNVEFYHSSLHNWAAWYKMYLKRDMFLSEWAMVMIEGLQEEQRRRWKEFRMTDETGEGQDPTRWGAWEAVCSAAWLTHTRSATARALPRVWRSRAQCAPTVNRQIHLFRHTKWQVEIQRKAGVHAAIRWGKSYGLSCENYLRINDRWGIHICIWWFSARKES